MISIAIATLVLSQRSSRKLPADLEAALDMGMARFSGTLRKTTSDKRLGHLCRTVFFADKSRVPESKLETLDFEREVAADEIIRLSDRGCSIIDRALVNRDPDVREAGVKGATNLETQHPELGMKYCDQLPRLLKDKTFRVRSMAGLLQQVCSAHGR